MKLSELKILVQSMESLALGSINPDPEIRFYAEAQELVDRANESIDADEFFHHMAPSVSVEDQYHAGIFWDYQRRSFDIPLNPAHARL